MKILLISYFFPPFNCIGAVRAGKTAKYLTKLGHEVRVISAKNQPLQETLTVEIPLEQVTYTNWLNINAIPEIFLGGRSRVGHKGYSAKHSFVNKLGLAYKTLLHFPDAQIGWLPYAVNATKKLLKVWNPDLIYTSAMPFTSLMIGYHLQKKYNIPWVAEFRDLWVDGHNYRQPKWRKFFEEKLEYSLLQPVKGLVTVSEPLAEKLINKYNKPTQVVLNAFDPSDYPNFPAFSFNISGSNYESNKLQIVYTGMIYPTGQDIKPLLESFQYLNSFKDQVIVKLYGRNLGRVADLIQESNLSDYIFLNNSVAYQDSLKLQFTADILLLLLWNNLTQKGVYSGKIFEYIGAERPILAIGEPHSVAAQLIQKENIGVILNQPDEIANQIKKWLTQKQYKSYIPSTSVANKEHFTRFEQTKVLEKFLKNLLKK